MRNRSGLYIHRNPVPCTLVLIACSLIVACSSQRRIGKAADATVFQDTAIQHAHVGISLFDVSRNRYIYTYKATKYFVPASNTKLFTAYAAMKYLGDSLPGVRYYENDTALYLAPTGDPSLLHSDFKTNPVINFLQKTTKHIYITDANWKEEALGNGWAWSDYNDDYMAERSALPIACQTAVREDIS